MSNTITSKVIGRLTQNKEFPSTWESKPVAIPFFDHKKIEMILDFIPEKDMTFLTEADQVLDNFLGLSAGIRSFTSLTTFTITPCLFTSICVGYILIPSLFCIKLSCSATTA